MIGRFGIALSIAATIGCGPATPAHEPSEGANAEAMWRSKCGNCHARPQPGTRSREALTAAFARHRRRVPLRSDQWSALVDFLAASPEDAPR